MDEHARRDVLGEALHAELQAIRESTDQIPEVKGRLGGVEDRLEMVEDKLDLAADATRDHIADKSIPPAPSPA